MGALKNSMIDFMNTRGYSIKTIKTYANCVQIFAYHFKKSPVNIYNKEIESFFLHLRQAKKSESTIHIYYESIKLFYKINKIENRLPKINFSRLNHRVPLILSQEKVIAMLNSCTSLKYKTIFSLIYSSGLRISELKNLTINDLDFDRKQVYIKNGKNGKDRYSILGDKAIALLKAYINFFRPNSYLFYSKVDSTKSISLDSIRRQFQILLAINDIQKSVHIHTLRHCFATHLMESGTNIFHIMHLLGHACIQTTMIYLRMQDLNKLNIVSPIDLLTIAAKEDNNPQKQLFPISA